MTSTDTSNLISSETSSEIGTDPSTTGTSTKVTTTRTARPRARRRRLLWLAGAALVVALAATACLPPGATSAADPGGVVNMINSKREANGMGALAGNAQLNSVAQNWAQQLAGAGHLAHQDLGSLIRSPYMPGWMRLTENVFQGGASATNALVVDAWMASSGHRANILDPGVNSVGVGVAHDGGGGTYVVADFGLR